MASLLDTIPYRPPIVTTPMVVTSAPIDKQKNKASNTVKVAAITGSITTTLLYLLLMAKNAQKGQFKFSDMFNVKFKNMYKVMGLATSSVIGGLTGGILADKKENIKPKLKEAVHQFLGNIIFPITIVGLAGQAIEKRNLSKFKEVLYSGLAAIAGVGAGVTGGNWVASKVNEAIFKEDDSRKVTIKDFGIHVDDLLTVAALTPIGNSIEGFTSKALPAIFLICGYEAGSKVQQPKN